MKMSDHFEQDLKACDITRGLGNTKFGLADSYGIASGEMQMKAAAHAINQHDQLDRENTAYSITVTNLEARCDKLVELNKELVEALGELSGIVQGVLDEAPTVNIGDHIDSFTLQISEKALAKAKELQND